MKINTLVFPALVALLALTGAQARADNMASVAITPATGAVTLVPRWVIGGSLAGFHFMAQDLSLGGGATQFYSIKSTPIPAGGDTLAFTRYIAASGAMTPLADIGSKLTPNAYSALTSADPDVGYGAVNLYLIHHKSTGDYFAAIIPGSGTSSAVTDEKPMNGPGGPATLSVSGYFGLTFAATDVGYGADLFYYLRNDSAGSTWFGTLVPALLGTSTDKFDLGIGGYNALEFTGTDVGYGVNKMYYLRLDKITGFTILGTLDPLTGRTSDIANLGSVYSTLSFVPGDVGFGSDQFYTTGAVNTTWQSVSFAAIDDRAISAGSFTVAPSASSGLPIALTVVPGSAGSASISGPVAGVFMVTPTAPGLITLQATQAGQLAPIAYEYNMLRQSFTATGATLLAITTQPAAQSAVIGTTANFSVAASGTSTLNYQWRKAGANITGNASATTATLTLTNVQTSDGASYDVVVSNSSGSIPSNAVILTVTGTAPVITNNPLTAAGTVGAPFSFAITAAGSPTSYSATGLPAGLTANTITGTITGTPTTMGTTLVLLGATNASGTGTATLTITVAAAGAAPVITNNPLTAAGTVGAPFSFAITAAGSPTSYSATGLPAGLTANTITGTITGTPTTVGTTLVLLGATNASGSGTATLTITVAAAGAAPVITNNSLTAAGTVGAPFATYLVTATGLPTSYTATGLPAGLTANTLTGTITGTPTTAGTSVVTLTATNATGTGTATLTITVAPAGVAPVISSAPGGTSVQGTVYAPFPTYQIVATGLPTSYTATGLPAGLTLDPLTGAINGTPTTAGTYVVTLTATNSTGSSTTTLTIVIAGQSSSRIVNFSARAMSGPGDQTLIVGFVITGDNKCILLRAIGPSLAPFGISDPLADPLLTLFNVKGTAIATNDNWQINSSGQNDGSVIAATAAQVGAFALPDGSTDSALLVTLNHGVYTGQVTSVNNTTGVALLEIYDTDNNSNARLVNVSARMNVTPGNGTLIAGLVITGSAPKTVLIRGVGPSLSSFGIPNFLANPMITVFSGSAQIASNDNWGNGPNTAALIAASNQVGAFPLLAGSNDAALLITLQPGIYTVQVTGVGNTSGVALVEVYDVQ